MNHDNMDHSAQATGDLSTAIMYAWTEWVFGTADEDSTFWLKGKYGTHMDLDGTMHLDFVT